MNSPDNVWNWHLEITFRCLLAIPVSAIVSLDRKMIVEGVLSAFSATSEDLDSAGDRAKEDHKGHATEKTSKFDLHFLSDDVFSMGLSLLSTITSVKPGIPAVSSILYLINIRMLTKLE